MPSPTSPPVAADAKTSPAIAEALDALRTKPVRSTTMERLRLTIEADEMVTDLPQPLQLGEGLYHLLNNISTPLAPHDLLAGRITEEVPGEADEALFQDTVVAWNNRGIPPWMRDGGHECFAWNRLLDHGLSDLESQARANLEALHTANAPIERQQFLQGAIGVYRALRRYAHRYAETARGAGMCAIANNCAAAAERAPKTFAEALQLIWLVGHVYCSMASINPTLTFGRLDELLLPFYRTDLAVGRLTHDEAAALISDFYCKNNLILGRGEHQMSGGSEGDTGWQRNLTYDAPQYIVLGGRRLDGSANCNELTALFLERIVPRFENPVVVLRYTPDLQSELWRTACDKMRANASMMVYNDAAIIPAMIEACIAPEHAVTYTMHGCNWPDVPGVQRTAHTHNTILPDHMRQAILDMADDIESIAPIEQRFLEIASTEIRQQCAMLRQRMATWHNLAPGILRLDDCFLDGPIERAQSWEMGGVPHRNLIVALCGLASAADALTAVESLVFGGGDVSLAELKRALEGDFVGWEALHRHCLAAPKFGQDNPVADGHAVRLLNALLDEIHRARGAGTDDAMLVFCCLESDMRHIRFGFTLGATADGRRAGEPISENSGPAAGVCTNGLTAMLRSMIKLPLHRVHSGALNVRMQPRLFRGEEGLNTLAALLRTYMEAGGLQVQLSFVDTAVLRDAQAHPAHYRDLMVRITGYSAAFVDMARHAQDEIIRREEMGAC